MECQQNHKKEIPTEEVGSRILCLPGRRTTIIPDGTPSFPSYDVLGHNGMINLIRPCVRLDYNSLENVCNQSEQDLDHIP
jgi:hypothetical protein